MPRRRPEKRARARGFAASALSGAARLRAAWPALLAPFLLAGCSSHNAHITFLNPQGPIALAERNHFAVVILMVSIVVVPVLVLTPFFAWRYRYGNTSRPYTPTWDFNWTLEFFIWGVPLGIVTTLGVWLAQDTVGLDPYRPLSYDPPLRIQVIGYDWKFLFVYPDRGVASIGLLALPVGRPLTFVLTSDTVLQSFFIPALGSQLYAMPGMVTRLNLLADTPGDYRGMNTQYNGDSFEKQKFTARAMSPADFDAWVQKVRATGLPLTQSAYHVLQQRNSLDSTREALGSGGAPLGAIYFKDASPKLFQDVVESFHLAKHSSGMMNTSPTAPPPPATRSPAPPPPAAGPSAPALPPPSKSAAAPPPPASKSAAPPPPTFRGGLPIWLLPKAPSPPAAASKPPSPPPE
jgi:cytochrome o ubiquinol oxidase subunit 2